MTDYFVRSSGGSDANDGLTFANGFATIQAGIDAVSAAGDRVLICADGNHTPTAAIDVDNTTAGTQASPIEVVGANATGTIDGTRPTIIGTSLPASTDMFLLSSGVTTDYWYWKDLILDGDDQGQNGFFEDDYGAINWIFLRCRFTQFTTNGVRFDQGGFANFYQCEFDNNGNAGCGPANEGAAVRMGSCNWIGCSFHDNTDEGMRVHDRGICIAHCEFYDNGGDGLYLNSQATRTTIILNNVMHGNGGNGLHLGSNSTTTEGDPIIMGNAFTNNTGDGVEWIASSGPELADYNHFDGNGTARDNFPTGDNDTSGDPLYTSETNGSEDFTPTSGSPLIDAGIEYFNGGTI